MTSLPSVRYRNLHTLLRDQVDTAWGGGDSLHMLPPARIARRIPTGFTLVELLVVVAIIAILAGMLGGEGTAGGLVQAGVIVLVQGFPAAGFPDELIQQEAEDGELQDAAAPAAAADAKSPQRGNGGDDWYPMSVSGLDLDSKAAGFSTADFKGCVSRSGSGGGEHQLSPRAAAAKAVPVPA